MTGTTRRQARPAVPSAEALAAMTPAEIDAVWFPLMDAAWTYEARLASSRTTLAKHEAVVESQPWRASNIDYLRAEIATAVVALAKLRDETKALDAEWDRRKGWRRGFTVQNADGHVHNTMRCPTCNNGRTATRFGLNPLYSGLTDDELIGLVGHNACTVCYPQAPTHPVFMRTAAEAEKALAAKEAATCPGSRQYAPALRPNAYIRQAVCPACGKVVGFGSRSSSLVRAHKREGK